ncbi:MAG: M24 family metallopeptidase [Candidatus Bathyarchaeia archaeon]
MRATTEIYRARMEKLKKAILNADGKGYIIGGLSNAYYLTGHLEAGDSLLFLLVTLDDRPRLVVNRMNQSQAEEEAQGVTVEGVKTRDKYVEAILDFASNNSGGPLFFDEISAYFYAQLTQRGSRIKLQQRSDLLWQLRVLKTGFELGLMKKAAELASLGARKAVEEARTGVKEYELAAEAEYAMRKHGAQGFAFETIVASGPRSAWPHGACGDRRLRKGDSVVMDLGATFKGYRSDITRTVFVGQASGTQRKLYRTVLSARRAALKKIKANVAATNVDASARRVIEAAGLGRFFVHGTGHGIGIDVHEPPRLSFNSKEKLPANAVVTVEPGVYIPDKLGVRIEDMVLVTDEGFSMLTDCPV